jgi:Ni/Fe-hydrogenase subunit HybB-like protein
MANTGTALEGKGFKSYDSLFGGRWYFRWTPYRVVGLGLCGLLVFSIFYRLIRGLGPATNLNDHWPWGLWIAFDDLSGIALAAGGFFTAFMAHILNAKKYKMLARAALITSLFGYLIVSIGVLMDLGRWYNFWRPLVFWGYHSWLFVVLWCVILYLNVQVLQLGHIVFERVNVPKMKKIFDQILPALFVTGIVIAFVHQSALGALYIAMIDRQDPLWWSMLLPLFFLLSAIFVGPAMCVIEGSLASKAYKMDFHHEMPLLIPVMKIGMWTMIVYFVLKIIDLAYRGHFMSMFAGTLESNLFLLALVAGVLIPIILLAKPNHQITVPRIVTAAVLMVGGLVLDRMNVVFTSMGKAMGGHYFPHCIEFSISIGLIAFLLMAYCFMVENFKIFPYEHNHAH